MPSSEQQLSVTPTGWSTVLAILTIPPPSGRTCMRRSGAGNWKSNMNLRRFSVPASLFGMVLGLSGWANGWKAAATLWSWPTWIGEALMSITGVVWVALMVLYALKWLHARSDAEAEVAHPIQCCFVALVPISTMLMGIALLPYAPSSARGLFCAGAVGTLVFGVWRHGDLWRGGRSPGATTPVLYLPTVAGNFVSAIGAVAMGWPAVGQVFFGAGVFAWLAIESVLLQRLLTAETMPPALRPTLGIQLAPPCVGLLAYVSVADHPVPIITHMLLGYGLLQALLLLRLSRWIVQMPLYAYWGVSFGITAVAAATLRLASSAEDPLMSTLAPCIFVVANVVLCCLALATIGGLVTGRLFPVPAPLVADPTPAQPPAPR